MDTRGLALVRHRSINRLVRKIHALVLVERFQDAMARARGWATPARRIPVRAGAGDVLRRPGQEAAATAPFAHIGIEVPTEQALDEIAARAKLADCLAMPRCEFRLRSATCA